MKNCIIILFLFISFVSWSQSSDEINRMINLHKIEQTDKFEFARRAQNEYDLVFSGLFLFYKSYISSQDGSHCTFRPSCSVYALQAIKKQGVFWGIVNFFDRFARCNSFSPEHYEADLRHKLLIDPLKDYKYE